MLLAVLHRANLDAFWSSATSTVNGLVSRLKAGLKFSKSLGLQGPYEQIGRVPDYDHCGYEVACHILLNSLNGGRNNTNYTQWITIRKMRTCFTTQVRASNIANKTTLAINDNMGIYQRISQDICGSFWFNRFTVGCSKRMGTETRQNKALSIPLLLVLIENVEKKIKSFKTIKDQHKWVVFITYVVVSYVISLRGNETFLLDLDGLNRHRIEIDQGYFIIALVGTRKGESNDRVHIIPCSNVTLSGIKVKETVYRLVDHKKQLGFIDGPVISDHKGNYNYNYNYNSTINKSYSTYKNNQIATKALSSP